MKLVKLTKKYLNETYSTARVDKHLSDISPIKNVLKQRIVLSPLIFHFPSE